MLNVMKWWAILQAATEAALADMAASIGVEVVYKAGVYTTMNMQVSPDIKRQALMRSYANIPHLLHLCQDEWHNGAMAFVLRRTRTDKLLNSGPSISTIV